MTDFMTDVVGVVDATTYEQLCLWEEEGEANWKENRSGYLIQVGEVGDMVVMVSMITAVVRGHKLLFIHPTSQVVDHRMIDTWLEEHLPNTARRPDGYLNRVNALNFSNVFHHMARKQSVAA